MSAGREVPMDRLTDAVWGARLPGNVRKSLQTYVSRLRRVLGNDLIVTTSNGYMLPAEPDHVDALRFLRLLDQASQAPDKMTERERLGEALELWRGEPFANVGSDWLHESEAMPLLERYLTALERRIDLDIADGRHGELVAELSALTARHLLREPLWARLLVVLDRCGRTAEALARYETIRKRIADELGVDPGPELQRIHLDLLTARPADQPGCTDAASGPAAGSRAALRVVPARAAAQPVFPLKVLAGQLRATRTGLDAFAIGDAVADVRTVFSWSYRTLSPTSARLFRLVGTHPGPDISTSAAASLAGFREGETRPGLAELTRAHLVTECGPGRYACHDLLRAYACELANLHDTQAERQAALHRVLDHYLHTAYRAAQLLNPHRDPISLSEPEPKITVGAIADHGQALAWFNTEHHVLVEVIARAAAAGFNIHAWQLAWALADYFDWQGHWHDQAATQRIALEAARRLADGLGQAHAHRDLGSAYTRLGHLAIASTHVRQAISLFADLGDDNGLAHARMVLDTERRAFDLCRGCGT